MNDIILRCFGKGITLPKTFSLSGSNQGQRVFIFNGDADGLISQHILGLTLGQPDLRITGLKRDIQLLRKLPTLDSAQIYVMDISLRQNQAELPALLANENIHLTWYDHHDPGQSLPHPRLDLHINQAPDTCTAAIVHVTCGRKHPLWAAMAAFGDNLPATGDGLAKAAGANATESALLRESGVLLNYNAYGEEPGDVCFDPADLAQKISNFPSALDFCHEESFFQPLHAQFSADQAHFELLEIIMDTAPARAYLVPNQPWARRYMATWANERILAYPTQALALLHPREDGTYQVSIRAPRVKAGTEHSAADLAGEFATGGGRKLAAGINILPGIDLSRFLERFRFFFSD
jgi:hypothetical protein